MTGDDKRWGKGLVEAISIRCICAVLDRTVSAS